ncbi:MAG: TolC family protein, partial [Sphingopyxis sp.]|nr:TolC family protein [Sphingopyxis sp.]
RTRARAGLVPEADAVRAEGLVVDAEARLAPIAGQRAAIAGQLAALVAVPAQDVMAMLQQPAGTQQFVTISSAPSALLRDRPDIAAAEFRLRAADADIEAAAARRFPNLSLSSGIGLLAFALGDIFDADALIGSLSANIAAPLLDFGRIQAEVDQRSAAAQEAFAQYRGAVFAAIGESEAAFGTVDAVDAQVALLSRQVALEEDATQLATVRYRNGLSDFSRVVEARRAANATRTTLAIAQGERTRSRILLWQALGGSDD